MSRRLGRRGAVLAAVAAGGVIGAEARYGLTTLQGNPPSFPWTTIGINISGCLLIGVLMAVVFELTAPHRLLRPFLGIGVLGGFTTFSTYAVDVRTLLAADRPAVALGYLLLTPLAALVAVWAGARITRSLISRRQRGIGP